MHRLTAEQVTFTIDGRTILSNCFLSIETGEAVGLFGRNGSGKTTLLRILYGVLTSGRGLIRHNDVYLRDNDRLATIIL